ncbi:760_t:CDS:1, partial [Funneliformis caledonium]
MGYQNGSVDYRLRYKDGEYPTGLGLREHPLVKLFYKHKGSCIAIPISEIADPYVHEQYYRSFSIVDTIK